MGEDENGVEGQDQAPEEVVGVEQSVDNPAWQPYLDQVPDGFKDQFRPVFQEWDKNTNQKFQDIHKQYEPLKQYESFAKQGIDPRVAQAGVALVQELQKDPQAFYERLGSAYGLTPAQAEQLVEDADNDVDETVVDPRLDQIQSQQEFIMNRFQEEQAQQAKAHADQELETEIQSLRQTHPDIVDEDMTSIWYRAIAGAQINPQYSLETAYQSFAQERANWAQNRPGTSAPRVLGNNGQLSTPSEKPWHELTDAEQKAIMLAELKGLPNA